eukprot:GHVN01022315.1.p1 GENE.GHVN01022315.1~~GHVN01022315.1.p1  ORF type:complete len:211 (-),score=50.98 GHVN01022315.1:113-745(-)
MCPELEIVVEIRNTRFTYLVCRKRPSPCTADTITSLSADSPTSLTSDTHTSDTPISFASDTHTSDTPISLASDTHTSHTLGRSSSADQGESGNCNKFEVETEKPNGSKFASPGTSTSTSTISFPPTSTHTRPESPTSLVPPMSTKPDRSDVHAAIDAEKKTQSIEKAKFKSIYGSENESLAHGQYGQLNPRRVNERRNNENARSNKFYGA